MGIFTLLFVYALLILVLRSNHAVVTAEVHEREEAEESVIIYVHEAIFEGLVLGIPKGIYKLLSMLVVEEQRGGCHGTYEADAVTESLLGMTGTEDFVILGQSAIHTILIHEIVHTL